MSEPGQRRPFMVGVTGGIACGKSTVLRRLAALGAATIDADEVYHELIAPGMPLNEALVRRFGPSIRRPDGSIDRRVLGEIVFADPAALADLDALTHPAVVRAIEARIAAAPAPAVAIDAVKLIESGLADACDRVWLVDCDPAQQVARLMARNGLDRAAAEARVAAQPPLGPRLARADLVIDNRGAIEETERQVDAAWRTLPVVAGAER